MLFTIAFWRGAFERAVSTFAQGLTGGLIVTAPIVEQPWAVALGIAGTATLLSFLKSLSVPDFTAGMPTAPSETGTESTGN